MIVLDEPEGFSRAICKTGLYEKYVHRSCKFLKKLKKILQLALADRLSCYYQNLSQIV